MSALPAETAIRAPARPRPWRPGKRHIVLIGNGNASGLAPRAALVNACRALGLRGIRVETHLTESLTELAAAWPSFGDRRVALLGGDGTLHAAANLPAGPAELAILPAGRANNVARALGVPLDLKVAAELAAEGSRAGSTSSTPRPTGSATAPSKGSASACTRSLGRATARRTQPILPPRHDRPSGQRERSTESRSRSRATACPRCSPSASSSSPTSPSTPSDCVLPRRPAGRRSPPRGQPPVGRTGASHPDDRATSARDTSAALAHAAGRRSASGSRRWQVAPHRGHNEPRDGAGDARGRPRSASSGGAMSIATQDLRSSPPAMRVIPLPYLIVFGAAALGAGLGRAVTTSYLPVLLDRIEDALGKIGTVMLVNAAAGLLVPLAVGVWSDRRVAGGEAGGSCSSSVAALSHLEDWPRSHSDSRARTSSSPPSEPWCTWGSTPPPQPTGHSSPSRSRPSHDLGRRAPKRSPFSPEDCWAFSSAVG